MTHGGVRTHTLYWRLDCGHHGRTQRVREIDCDPGVGASRVKSERRHLGTKPNSATLLWLHSIRSHNTFNWRSNEVLDERAHALGMQRFSMYFGRMVDHFIFLPRINEFLKSVIFAKSSKLHFAIYYFLSNISYLKINNAICFLRKSFCIKYLKNCYLFPVFWDFFILLS